MIKCPTKVVVRNLPKSMTKDQFLMEVDINHFNYFRFCGCDKNNKLSTTRAYLNFFNEDQMYKFKDYMENRIFFDELGNENFCIVEFAVYQKVPGKSKVDSKQNTLLSDPEFMKFSEEFKEPFKHVNIGSVESNLEEIKNKESEKMNIKTALIEYLASIPKKERSKKEDYRRKTEYIKGKKTENNIESNNDIKQIVKTEINNAIKKNQVKDSVNDGQMKNESLKNKTQEKLELKKGKMSQRNDIKMYAAAYEDYEYESRDKRGFENKNYRSGRAAGYEGDDSGAYYYNSRNADPYYRSYGYGYGDYSVHPPYSRAPPPSKNKRGGGRRPPAYSATRKD